MNDPVWLRETDSDSRPKGFVRPTHERAVRALAALQDARLADAEKHVIAIPDSPMDNRAWKLYLRGLTAIQKREFADAETLLLQAAATASIWAWSMEDGTAAEGLRLLASCLEKTGLLYRRSDRPDDAYTTHLAALHLRCAHGSIDERWETLVSLGLDADVARRYADAENWYRRALSDGARADEEAERKQAAAWSHLAVCLTAVGRHEEAVHAARTARDFWRAHDPGATAVAKADLALGHALLQHGESLYADDSERTRLILHEARDWLTAAHESLLAFGPECAADAGGCQEQLDFAGRLLASLDG